MRTEIDKASIVIQNLVSLIIDSDKTNGSTSIGYQKAYSIIDRLLGNMNQAIKELAVLLPKETE